MWVAGIYNGDGPSAPMGIKSCHIANFFHTNLRPIEDTRKLSTVSNVELIALQLIA